MEYRAVVWRIFGAGHSPFAQRSTYEWIEPVVNERLPANERRPVIAEISRWFASDHKTVVPESEETVAASIVEAVGNIICQGNTGDDFHTAAWAIGSIDADRAARITGGTWTADQIDSFTNVAMGELKSVIEQGEIFDPDRTARYAGTEVGTKVTVDVANLGSGLEAFRYLNDRGLSLVYSVREEATNLIRLMLAMRPNAFGAMLERLDHPVLQACAAHHAVYDGREAHYDRPLSWITRESSAAGIALAIVHTLNAVDRLDDARGDGEKLVIGAGRSDAAGVETQTGELATGLVERLGTLDPVDCARWIGEVLSTASYVLHGTSGDGIPHRVKQLENACIALVARHAGKAGADDVLNAFVAGLRTNRQRTWTRHLAELAWILRDIMPARSSEIAGVALSEYEGHVADHMAGGRSMHLPWYSWEHREWMRGLGVALALSCKDIELPEWVTEKCNGLPLSVWDVEEDYQMFCAVEAVVRYWFLIAFLGIRARKELGCAVDPSEVLRLTDLLWTHDDFMNRHLHRVPKDDVIAEHGARYAMEFGEPSDTWLIESISHPGVSPQALWALIDQRVRRDDPVSATDRQDNGITAAELCSIASERFGDGSDYNVGDLVFWGRLWLLLGAVDEAEKTADALRAVPEAALDHKEKLIVLKLLALVASKRPVANDAARYMQHLYRDLWPGSYTPADERDDRSLIDHQLSGGQVG